MRLGYCYTCLAIGGYFGRVTKFASTCCRRACIRTPRLIILRTVSNRRERESVEEFISMELQQVMHDQRNWKGICFPVTFINFVNHHWENSRIASPSIVLFCPLLSLFPIFSGFVRFVRGLSGDFLICPFPLFRPTNSTYEERPERVCDTIQTFPEKVGKPMV